MSNPVPSTPLLVTYRCSRLLLSRFQLRLQNGVVGMCWCSFKNKVKLHTLPNRITPVETHFCVGPYFRNACCKLVLSPLSSIIWVCIYPQSVACALATIASSHLFCSATRPQTQPEIQSHGQGTRQTILSMLSLHLTRCTK